MKVVFDTNVLISATMWDNSISYKLLIKLIQENREIISCVEILKEYQKVLTRDFKYTEIQTKIILEKLAGFLKLVNLRTKPNIIKDDPADNIVLACALASNSKVILSYDKHLLKLKEFNGIKIITPDEFMKRKV